jgi:lipopolysaccharide export system protein LptA
MKASRRSAHQRCAPVLAFALGTLACFAVPAFVPAAYAQAVSDAFSNLSVDSDQPVRIEADQLEVSDSDKTAVFSGNVVVNQGTTSMQAAKLTVHYTGEGTAAPDATDQRVSKLEADGKVVVKADGQTATGDWAVFDMATQEVTLGGTVVLSQGKNVLRGTQLVVNLQTGKSTLVAEQPKGGSGRVQGLFIPGSIGQKQEQSQDQSN